MESKFARILALTGREIIAKSAGSISAVCELSADCVVHITTGISHNTGAWCDKRIMHITKGCDTCEEVQILIGTENITYNRCYCTC